MLLMKYFSLFTVHEMETKVIPANEQGFANTSQYAMEISQNSEKMSTPKSKMFDKKHSRMSKTSSVGNL